MKAVVAAFNQEKALVGAFSVITNLRMDLFQALLTWLPLLPILWMTRQVNTAKHSAVLIRPEVENRLVILTVEVTRGCVGAETRSCEQQRQGAGAAECGDWDEIRKGQGQH